jgi:hypothetical protein
VSAGKDGYVLTDTLGNVFQAKAGTAVIFDGATLNMIEPAPPREKSQDFTIESATDPSV